MSRSGSHPSAASGSSHFANRQAQQQAVSPPGGGVINPPYTVHPLPLSHLSDEGEDNFNVDNNAIFPLTQRNTPPRVSLLTTIATKGSSTQHAGPQMSMAVLILIVVASLCMIVGAIYLLIYFKSIKPMSARSRSYADPGSGKGDDDGGARKSAGHPFFRRK